MARARRGGARLGLATAPGAKLLRWVVCSVACRGAAKLSTRLRPSALTSGGRIGVPPTGVARRVNTVPPPSMLMLRTPASGNATAWGPRSSTAGWEVVSRPSQLVPWLVCSSWGALPAFSITTSTPSRTRRTFRSSGSAPGITVPVVEKACWATARGPNAVPTSSPAAPTAPTHTLARTRPFCTGAY
ncbi:MAG: hypothetical protein ACO3ZD_10675 [Cyanobium sp.]